MTLRDVFEHCLTELNKVQAPPLLLKDFIYWFNKATQQYFNTQYNLFEINQQLTDNLRVLQNTVAINPTPSNGAVFGQSYDCPLPEDYVHILNCICEFIDTNPDKACEGSSTVFHQGANRLDSNKWPQVITNAYNKPSVKRPYYYLTNIQNPNKDINYLPDSEKDMVTTNGSEKRYGNSTQPTMQIKCGNDKRYRLNKVFVEYLRAPEYLSIDQELLDNISDESQVIEYPDYVIYEIINQLVALIQENEGNPRLQSYIPVNKTVDVSATIPQK